MTHYLIQLITRKVSVPFEKLKIFNPLYTPYIKSLCDKVKKCIVINRLSYMKYLLMQKNLKTVNEKVDNIKHLQIAYKCKYCTTKLKRRNTFLSVVLI